MRRLFTLAALLFALPAHAVTIDWVTVGDPGNPGDTEVMSDGTTGYGAVPYIYRISKYEVTNAQYAEFLNAVAKTDTNGLYNATMVDPFTGYYEGYGGITRSGSSGNYTYATIGGRENMPVNWVSFYDALRFANWLHNGQPTGAQDSSTTEDGAYTITADGIANNSIMRNAGATIFLPSEDEWYKAAYYDGTSYFEYSAGFDTQITCAVPGATPNTANCNGVMGGSWGDLTDVGAYTGSASPNGTFDQGGNVWEWNEAIIHGWDRGLRGAGFFNQAFSLSARMSREGNLPIYDYFAWGFRVAMIRECDDALDNDGDGLTDFVGGDPGCTGADDLSENDPTLPCDDGADNDSDGALDYPADIGCKNPSWSTESPQCSDGIDNSDNDDPPLADWDGAGMGDPDPQCSAPWDKSEAPSSRSCGLGVELALLLPPLMWLFWRRKRRL